MSRVHVMNFGGGPTKEFALDNDPDLDDLVLALSMRRLLAAYSGSAIEAKIDLESGENIGFIGEALNEQDLLAYAGADACGMQRWYDQSGEANHGVQTTQQAGQPLIADSGSVIKSGARAAPLFVRSNSTHMDLPTGILSTKAFTISAVAVSETISGTGRLITYDADSIHTSLMFNSSADNVVRGNVRADGSHPNIVESAPDVLELHHLVLKSTDGGDLSLFVDGVKSPTVATGVWESIADDGVMLGADRLASGSFLDGHLLELVMWNTEKTDAQAVALAAQASAYYGTPEPPSGELAIFDSVAEGRYQEGLSATISVSVGPGKNRKVVVFYGGELPAGPAPNAEFDAITFDPGGSDETAGAWVRWRVEARVNTRLVMHLMYVDVPDSVSEGEYDVQVDLTGTQFDSAVISYVSLVNAATGAPEADSGFDDGGNDIDGADGQITTVSAGALVLDGVYVDTTTPIIPQSSQDTVWGAQDDTTTVRATGGAKFVSEPGNVDMFWEISQFSSERIVQSLASIAKA